MALLTDNPDLELLKQGQGIIPPNQGIIPPNQGLPVEDETEEVDNPEEEAAEEEENRILYDLFRKAEKEDEDLRLNLIRVWKRNEYYFNNIQKIFFDGTAGDYRSIDSIATELASASGIDDVKTINIYRATAESIVAALSNSTPNVEFTPDDADEPDDIETAEAYTKIAELVSKHNKASLMLIKALTTLYNQGVVAAYNYYKTDPSYGTIKIPSKTEKKPKPVVDLQCNNCGEMIDTNVPQEGLDPNNPIPCPNCKTIAPPTAYSKIEFEDEVVEYEDTPKGRSGFDLFGPTYVKMPLYARNQAGIGYLILRVEDNVAKFKTVYTDYRDKIQASGGDTYSYERWGRIPPEYYGTLPKQLTTLRTGWFRPWYFNELGKEDADTLIAKYPNGIMLSVIGECIVDKQEEKLDDRWTITFDPKANFIHAEPAGNATIPLQDAENDIFNLGLQSIEYGIPETFVNPRTLNLNKYGSTKAAPGNMTAALPPGPDKGLSDGFHTVKTATLSNEYTTFAASITEKNQFVSGAVPSLFGGTAEGQPQTATVYTESRNRALQRQQLTWQMISVFWCSLIAKCVKDYAKNLREDERFAKKQNGTFVNVWIRKSQLNGSVGEVEPEINGQIPQSWSQKKDFIMNLISMMPQSPELGAILLNPNNTETLKQVTGMPDFYIPGEKDAVKQNAEFYELSIATPVSDTEPSIMPDIDVDDHIVHMLVLKNRLVSAEGLQLYKTNPAGYQNNILHYRMHEMMNQAKTIAPSGNTAAGEKPQSAVSSTQA